MDRDKKMVLGYIVGGLLVFVLVPSIIYIITSIFDTVYRVAIIQNSIITWIIIILLLVIGLLYGIWSVIIQNAIGEGGPVELGNIEISPKTKNLVVSGPYKNTRNPMLFGTFLIYLAFALYLNSLIAVILVCLFIVLMLLVEVKSEEKRLHNDFGMNYDEYRSKTSLFIPWFNKK